MSGTPPDAFSETGQLWGSPLYDWAAHEAEGYRWWASRLGRALALHDEVRIDHFRGLAGYWSVPGDAPTALSGCWKLGPGLSFFNGIKARLGAVPLVAEDLGVITADVVELREAIGAPGMAVLQFGWDGNPKNPHLPHNHYENSFVYPGTHDNETMAGWFENASATHRNNFCSYLGGEACDPAWDALRMCSMGVAGTVVVAMQDVLRLDNTGRMNTPGVAAGNWSWRMGPAGVFSQLVSALPVLCCCACASVRASAFTHACVLCAAGCRGGRAAALGGAVRPAGAGRARDAAAAAAALRRCSACRCVSAATAACRRLPSMNARACPRPCARGGSASESCVVRLSVMVRCAFRAFTFRPTLPRPLPAARLPAWPPAGREPQQRASRRKRLASSARRRLRSPCRPRRSCVARLRSTEPPATTRSTKAARRCAVRCRCRASV